MLRSIHRPNLVFVVLVTLIGVSVLFMRQTMGFPHLDDTQLRIAIIAVSALAAIGFLGRGLLVALSRTGGWRAAAWQFSWATAMFLLMSSQLWAVKKSSSQMWMLIAAAVFALSGALLSQQASTKR